MIRSKSQFQSIARWFADGNTFGSHVALTMVTNIVLMLSGVGTGSITARLLGVNGRGELASIQLWASLIVTLGVVGLPAAVTYYSSRSPANAGAYYITAITIALLLAIPLMALAYLNLPYLLSSQTDSTIRSAQVYLLFVPPSMIAGLSLAPLQGQTKLLSWNLLRLAASLFWLIGLGLLALGGSASPQLVSICSLVVIFMLAALYFWTVLVKTEGPFMVRPALAKPLLSYGVPSSLATIPTQSNLKLDQLLMAALFSPGTLGLYVVAVAWSGALTPLLSAISYVVFPYMSRLHSDEHRGAALARIMHGSFLLNLVLAAALALVTPLAVRILFGLAFEPAIPVIYVLIVGSVISSMKSILAESLRGLGLPKAVMVGELIGFGVTGLLLLTLLSTYGLMGAAVISVLGYGVTFVLLMIFSARSLNLTMSQLLVPTREDYRYIVNNIRSSYCWVLEILKEEILV